MKKHWYRDKKWLGIILFACAFLVVLGIYFSAISVQESNFDFSAGMGSAESPDGSYKVALKLCSERELQDMDLHTLSSADDVYVIARVYWKPVVRDDGLKIWETKRSRVVYYDQYNGLPCTVKWANEEIVEINGKTLKMPGQRFDYRFSWN